MMAPRTPRPRPARPPPGDDRRAPARPAAPARWAGAASRCIFPRLVPNRSASRGYLLRYALFSLGSLFAALLLRAAACHPDFKLGTFSTNEALYRAGVGGVRARAVGQRGHGVREADDATCRRATRCCRARTGTSRARTSSAANSCSRRTSFTRLVESFPDDTLADDAALEAARVVQEALAQAARSTRTYGESARWRRTARCSACIPTSPLIPQAQKELADARGDVRAEGLLDRDVLLPAEGVRLGDHLLQGRRREVSRARRRRGSRSCAWWTSYKAIRYKEDAADRARSFDAAIPDDAEVSQTCVDVACAGAIDGRLDAGRLHRRRARPRAEACASASSAGASTRRTSGTCFPCSTRPSSSGSTACASCRPRSSRSRWDEHRPAPADRLAMTERLVQGDPRLRGRARGNRPGRVILHG